MIQHYLPTQRLRPFYLAVALLIGIAYSASAQIITTVAGNGSSTVADGTTGYTQGVAVDASGNLYVAAGIAHVVRKIATDGTYSTIAGTGTSGYSGDGGPATAARLNNPVDLYVSGNALYIADQANYRVRKVDLATNVITTVAGDGTSTATGTSTGFTQGVAVDASGNVYVAAGTANVVRKIATDGTYSTIAGSGTRGYSGDGGSATAAALNNPVDLYWNENALYFADQANYRVRKVDLATNVITTVAGDGTTTATGTSTGYTQGVTGDGNGNLFVAGGNSYVIRKIASDGTYSTIAGTGTRGYSGDEGTATAATLNNPVDVTIIGRDLYLTDQANYRVRKVTNVTTLATSTTPLPVVLASFTAACQGADALLKWATASEQHSAYFGVESSTDGYTFRSLTQVAAQGSSTHQQVYQLVDRNVARYVAEQVYYRLRQVDADGTTTYSPVRTLSLPALSPLAMQVYPNPAAGTALRVQVQAASGGPATRTVMEATGRTKLTRITCLQPGTTTIPLVEAATWVAGIYLLRVAQGPHQQTFRLLLE